MAQTAMKNKRFADEDCEVEADEFLNAKASLYKRLRAHVCSMKKEDNVTTFGVAWPVDLYFKPLGVDPECILKAKKLSDVTWHDVPSGRWVCLSDKEKQDLQGNVWCYANTTHDWDVAQAAVELAKEIRKDQDLQTTALGVTFAFAEDAGWTEPSVSEEGWFAAHAKASIFDWASINRKKFQAETKAKILDFVDAHAGKISIEQREARRPEKRV